MFEMFERGDPKKMYIIIGQQRWLLEHAENKKDIWYCKSTGCRIELKVIGRSIWLAILGGRGGIGEVRPVTHFYCPLCEEEPNIEPGTPIYDVELKALSPTPQYAGVSTEHSVEPELLN